MYHHPCSQRTDGDKKVIEYRKRGDDCDNNFKEKLENSNVHDILLINDVDLAYSNFNDIMFELYNTSYPIIRKRISQNNSKSPWMTPGLRESIKNKNRLYKKFLKRPITYGDTYRAYRNYLSKIIKSAKDNYYKNKFSNCQGNIKKSWKNINVLLGKNVKANKPVRFKCEGSFVEGEKNIANAFNDYYCRVGLTTTNTLRAPARNFRSYLPNNNFTSIEWSETTEIEVKSVIINSKTTSPGPDNLPMFIFKNNIEFLSPIVTHLCNLSISTGIFPELHKTLCLKLSTNLSSLSTKIYCQYNKNL